MNPITKDSTEFQFEWSEGNPYYQDISKMYLMAWMSIVRTNKVDGTREPIDVKGENLCPISFIPDGCFQELEIYLNGYKVTGNK